LESSANHISGILKKISRQDDEKALKELFDAFYGKLIEIAKFFVDDQFLAQDIVSEVFIKLWKNRSNLEEIKSIDPYLYIATKRQSLNQIRNNKKKNHVPIENLDTTIHVESRSPENILFSKEFAGIIKSAINNLPSKCRLVYTLVKDDGMKYQEVADTLGISVKTVEMHVGKALKRIKIAFDNYQK
jgi:RNA polymerase sigma-70 factor (ECF subfamily)